MTAELTPLDATSVLEHLRNRGFALGPDGVAEPLLGGVSGEVFMVRSGTDRWVVKQPLSQLRVAGTWLAKPERANTEAAALAELRTRTPDHVPELLDFDPLRLVMVMTAAPPAWQQWKESLLAAAASPESVLGLAAGLGELLATWHRTTWKDDAIADRFDDDEAFEQLRLAPFHRAVQEAHPGLPAIAACILELQSARECLVHGDLSPKNVLWSADGFWVLDFEVARFGAAVFDPAMLLAHLAAKAIHHPERALLMRRAGERFLASYEGGVAELASLERLGWRSAAILLARVDGRSPVGYLTENGRRQVRAVARRVLQLPNVGISDLWDDIIGTTS